jgi:hypothetical protein
MAVTSYQFFLRNAVTGLALSATLLLSPAPIQLVQLSLQRVCKTLVSVKSAKSACEKPLWVQGYIHLNPARMGFVEKAEYWIYSSQRNYSGLERVLEIDIADV